MAERIATIASRVGLHARPAAIFAEAAGDQPLEVTIALEGEPIEDALDASSILSLMGLGAEYGTKVVLRAEGEGAEAILESLAGVSSISTQCTEITRRLCVQGLQAHDATNNHQQENHLQDRDGFHAGRHRIDNRQSRANADPHGVRSTNGQIAHRIGQSGHAEQQSHPKNNGGRYFSESVGFAQRRSPDGLKNTGKNQNKPGHDKTPRGPSCRTPGTAPIVRNPLSG